MSTPAAPATEAGRLYHLGDTEWELISRQHEPPQTTSTRDSRCLCGNSWPCPTWMLITEVILQRRRAIEREATQQAAGLTAEREALLAIVDHTREGRAEAAYRVAREALARLPAAAARPEIDVERLAAALERTWLETPRNFDPEWRGKHVRLIAADAAEWYARLSSLNEDSP